MFIACLLAVGYALPWRCGAGGGSARDPVPSDTLLALWKARAVLGICLAFWAATQILHLPLLWGPNSIVAPAHVTGFTGDGWLCRIYVTAALGVAAPLSAWTALFMLESGVQRKG